MEAESKNLEKLKELIIEELTYLSTWKDNGETREYKDIDKEEAQKIVEDIFETWNNTLK